MFEEPIRFFEDVIKNNRSVLDMLYGNYTFVNPDLAKHYGMSEIPEFSPPRRSRLRLGLPNRPARRTRLRTLRQCRYLGSG